MNMKRFPLFVILLVCALPCLAETIEVSRFRYAGPYEVLKPFATDSLDVSGKPYTAGSVFDQKMSFDALRRAGFVNEIPAAQGSNLHLVGFNLQCSGFVKAELKLEGAGESRFYLDGRKQNGFKMKLEPATHELVLMLYSESPLDSLRISVETGQDGQLSLREDGRRSFSLDINTDGVSCGGVSVSAGGKFAAVTHNNVQSGGKSSSYTEIVNLADGSVRPLTEEGFTPSPQSFDWSRADSQIYFLAEDKDCMNLYRLGRHQRPHRREHPDVHGPRTAGAGNCIRGRRRREPRHQGIRQAS